MNSKTLASIQRLKIVELFGKESSLRKQPSFLAPGPSGVSGLFRRLEGKRKEAFHTITDFTLLHVFILSRNYK